MPLALPTGWTEAHRESTPEREARFRDFSDLPLHPGPRALLARHAPRGVFAHQYAALEAFARGEDVCLTTGTASGKTLAFQAAGAHILEDNSTSNVLALYPQKALGNQQERRWRSALEAAGVPAQVGRIDGGVPVGGRGAILDRCRVLIATPDVVHAWLLSRIGEAPVRRFLANLRLIIVDEVHTYSGVLGSNAAYLFRRTEHVVNVLGGSVRYFAASATIRAPAAHAKALFGRDLSFVGPDLDSSPRSGLDLRLVRPPAGTDSLSAMAALSRHIIERTTSRFIVFVDSRKQTELIAAIANRESTRDGPQHEPPDPVPDESAGTAPGTDAAGHTGAPWLDALDELVARAQILPYRAGYEDADRAAIEQRLASGSLRGVVSTSALELGIDLAHLDLGVLYGVPQSSTALLQRVGRVGRAARGEVLVVHAGGLLDDAVFANPAELLQRPPAEGALYLENRRIQYIHSLCLARQGGEHDSATASADQNFTTTVSWPPGFVDLCVMERTGQIPPDLRAMKAEAGDEPNYSFPLRDVEAQFKVTLRLGPIREGKGQLSHSQVMREAYPGAVYHYIGQALRVTNVAVGSKAITVRRERNYSTKPITLPTLVFPNLQKDLIVRAEQRGPLALLETDLQITETVAGYRERRGGSEHKIDYPLHATAGIAFHANRFRRNFFTSGVVLRLPEFDSPAVELSRLAGLLFEGLLMTAPYERADLGFGVDQFRAGAAPFTQGDKFLCIYDQTYGSLRLSGRLLHDGILEQVVERACALAAQVNPPLSAPSEASLARLRQAAAANAHSVDIGTAPPEAGAVSRARVIMPGNRGLNTHNGNTLFLVTKVLVHPILGLAYRGAHEGGVHGASETVPVGDIAPISGDTQMGWYDFDTGEVAPDGPP